MISPTCVKTREQSHMAENPCTTLVPTGDPAIRQAIQDLLKSADHASVQRLYSTLTKTRGIHHSCAVRPTLKSNWQPKSIEEARSIIAMMRDRIGLVHAVPTRVVPHSLDRKLPVSNISTRLMDLDGASRCKSDQVAYSHRVSAVMCRVVESAREIAAEEGVDTTISMHGSHDSLKHCRGRQGGGSGIAYRRDEEGLLSRAIDRVEKRFTPHVEE